MIRLNSRFKTQITGSQEAVDDAFLCKDNLFVVVDGAGGQYYGAVERERACQIIHSSFFDILPEVQSPGKALIFAIQEANKEVFRGNEQTGQQLVMSVNVVYISDKRMYFTHLGDCRIYCLHDGELLQLTRDHTLADEKPFLQPKSREPQTENAITKGLGIDKSPDIDVKTFLLGEKDLIISATDGLTGYLPNKEIFKLSSKTNDIEKLGTQMVEAATERGSSKMVTLGLIKPDKSLNREQKRQLAFIAIIVFILSITTGYFLKIILSEPQSQPVETDQPIESEMKKPVKPELNKVINEVLEDLPKSIKPAIQKTEQKEEPSLQQEIEAFVISWKDAWENTSGKEGDLDHYISFYSDDFVSKRLDKKGWKKDKARKNRLKRWINLKLDNIRVSELVTKKQVEVRFSQHYQSSNYSGTSEKILILRKETAGWKILAEKSP
ncbi:protein phosphatase 2C domain-containing protein [Thermodesulfobacteriota bacterium]